MPNTNGDFRFREVEIESCLEDSVIVLSDLNDNVLFGHIMGKYIFDEHNDKLSILRSAVDLEAVF